VKILIVAKTHMKDAACVGGIIYETGQGVRLLTKNGNNQPANTPFEVGQIWELDLTPHDDPELPHTEDVFVYKQQYHAEQKNIGALLLRRVYVWRGSWRQIFDSLIRLTHNGSGYISQLYGIPSHSTGFWLPAEPLYRTEENNKIRYLYREQGFTLNLPYTGFAPAHEASIAAGTLVRLSLARWWQPAPDAEARCYLQLSGWYF
jgi:hypothetical protein